MLHLKHGKQYHWTMVTKTTLASFEHNSVGSEVLNRRFVARFTRLRHNLREILYHRQFLMSKMLVVYYRVVGSDLGLVWIS
jgi:hypothetical protein